MYTWKDIILGEIVLKPDPNHLLITIVLLPWLLIPRLWSTRVAKGDDQGLRGRQVADPSLGFAQAFSLWERSDWLICVAVFTLGTRGDSVVEMLVHFGVKGLQTPVLKHPRPTGFTSSPPSTQFPGLTLIRDGPLFFTLHGCLASLFPKYVFCLSSHHFCLGCVCSNCHRLLPGLF